jgi:hypothetical protein
VGDVDKRRAAMTGSREKTVEAYYRAPWEIDPTQIGRCNLMDFFCEEVFLLDGVASILCDIGIASDVPGEPKVAQLGLDSLFGFQKSIQRATWSLREKVEALNAQMCAMGTVLYPGHGAPPVPQVRGQAERSAATGQGATMAPPASSTADRKRAPVAGEHPEDLLDDLRSDLLFLDQALAGLRAEAEDSVTEPDDFEPAHRLTRRLIERVENIQAALANTSPAVQPGRDQLLGKAVSSPKTEPKGSSRRRDGKDKGKRPAVAQA